MIMIIIITICSYLKFLASIENKDQYFNKKANVILE